MKTPAVILLIVLVLASLVFVACGGGTTSDTASPTETLAPQVSDEPEEPLSQELLEVELEDVDLSEALADITEILNGLDPDLLDLSGLGLDEALIDVSVLPDAGTAVSLGFDQIDLGQ